MTTDPSSWSEADSQIYREIVPIAVPRRDALLTAALTAVPGPLDAERLVVDVGTGTGILARAALEAFPRARVVALDGAPEMRETATRLLAPHRDRATVAGLDLLGDPWQTVPDAPDVLLASLSLHHLHPPDRCAWYREARRRLGDDGALVVIDLVAPGGPASAAVFAAEWDAHARDRAHALDGHTARFDRFEAEAWNLFRHPDPVDRPAPLLDEIDGLRRAGFAGPEVLTLVAGHAVFAGLPAPASDAASGWTPDLARVADISAAVTRALAAEATLLAEAP